MTQTMVIPWGAVLANLLKKPHIWNIREYGNIGYKHHFILAFEQVKNFIISNSSYVTTCGKNLKKFLFVNNYLNKVFVAYSHIRLEQSDQIEKNNENLIKIIMPSAITPNKGQIEALKALNIIINEKKYKNIKLILIGEKDESYYKLLQKYIKENILENYINFKDFSYDATTEIKHADIVLSCSSIEAQGRTTIEGQLLGKAIIASNTGESPILVKNNQTGLIYEYGNAYDLAEKIMRFIEKPSLIQQYGKNAQQMIHQLLEKNYQEDIIYQVGIKLKSDAIKETSTYSINKIFDLFSQFNNYHQQKIIVKKDEKNLCYAENVLVESDESFIVTFNLEGTINDKIIYSPIENAICKLQISKISIYNQQKTINLQKENLLKVIKTSIKPDRYNWYSFDHDRPTFELNINEPTKKIIIYGKMKIANPLSTFHQKNVLINDLKDEINQLRDSTAYKVGSFITNGPKSLYLKIKKLMEKNESK